MLATLLSVALQVSALTSLVSARPASQGFGTGVAGAFERRQFAPGAFGPGTFGNGGPGTFGPGTPGAFQPASPTDFGNGDPTTFVPGSGFPAAPSGAPGFAQGQSSALYFMTNSPNGNELVAMSLSPENGTLSDIVTTSTGGNGAPAIFAMNPDGSGLAGPDSLFSQDGVIVGGNYIFVPNAGSNTLSMFLINPQDPLNPTLVGTPQSTIGNFPMSVAYSEVLNMACVLCGGSIAGVTCFSVDSTVGLTALDTAPRDISIAINQTNPPTGPTNTASDIAFNPSQNALFVAIKGGMAPGYLFAWPVVDGAVATTAVPNVLSKVILPFSITFLGTDDRFFLSDAAGTADILDVSYPSLAITEEVFIQLPADIGAACWTEWSPELNKAYVMSGTSTNVTVVDATSGAITDTIIIDTADLAMEDAIIVGRYLYILTDSQNIAIVDLVQGVQVSNFDISSLGARKFFMGLSAYTNGPQF